MGIQKITQSQFETMIGTAITDRDSTMDVNIGAIRDLFISPIASVLENQNNRVAYVSRLTSLRYANQVDAQDLDDLVFNESIVRWTGRRSITTVVFARISAPVVDITVPINFPLSTPVDPKTGRSVMFRTTETQTMYAASSAQYYNAETERYELEVQVASVETGESARVGPNTITQFRRPFAEFDDVTNNTASTVGSSQETNAELAERYRLHVTGSQLGTPAGLKSHLLDNFSSVEDAYVVYGNDSFLTREVETAGAVDIWLKGESLTSRQYVTTYPGVLTLIPVDRLPLESVTSVISGVTTYVEGTDYEVVIGEGEFSYSIRGSDGIRFLTTGSHPDVGDPLTITFRYNGLINTISSYYTQPAQYSLAMDRLFRWAQAEEIEIEGSLKVNAGSPTVVRDTVKSAILLYINSLSLGDDVEEFDIDATIAKVYGVDNFTWTKLAVKNGSGIADIEIDPNKYASLDASDLIINLV